MRIKIRQNAESGTRFGATAFDSQIGKHISAEIASGRHVQGVVRGAQVVDDGEAVVIDLELPDDEQTARLAAPVGPYDIGLRP
jgi:hypothetical protein